MVTAATSWALHPESVAWHCDRERSSPLPRADGGTGCASTAPPPAPLRPLQGVTKGPGPKHLQSLTPSRANCGGLGGCEVQALVCIMSFV